MVGVMRCSSGKGAARCASGIGWARCATSCTCADAPSSLLVTLPNADSWGDSGAACSPSVSTMIIGKQAGDFPFFLGYAVDCWYAAYAVCIGGVSTDVYLLHRNFPAGWKLYFAGAGGFTVIRMVTLIGGSFICNPEGDYARWFGSAPSAPTTVGVS